MRENQWNEIYTKTSNAVRKQLFSQKSVSLRDTISSHLLDATTGGILFFLGVSSSQLIFHTLHIGAATPVLPRALGLLAIGTSSAISVHFSSLPRVIINQIHLKSSKEENSNSFGSSFLSIWNNEDQKSKTNPSITEMLKVMNQETNNRVSDFTDSPFSIYMLMGLSCFYLLGGSTKSIAPSQYENLGAFHMVKASLPATVEYATTSERAIIREFGRLYGCHTCGVKKGVDYHADHQPPKLVAAHRNSSWLRKFRLLKPLTFRFYPQCTDCSNQQGSVVRLWSSKLKTHYMSLRTYHTTGFWLVLLCASGLYIGLPNDNIHHTSDTSNAARDGISNSDRLKNDIPLIDVLRGREYDLRQRKSSILNPPNDAEKRLIDEELVAIRSHKKILKSNSKQQDGWSKWF